jgi:hypothetical protein
MRKAISTILATALLLGGLWWCWMVAHVPRRACEGAPCPHGGSASYSWWTVAGIGLV